MNRMKDQPQDILYWSCLLQLAMLLKVNSRPYGVFLHPEAGEANVPLEWQRVVSLIVPPLVAGALS